MSSLDIDWWSKKLSNVGSTTAPEERLLALQDINTNLKKATCLEADVLRCLLCSPEIYSVLGAMPAQSSVQKSGNIRQQVVEKPSTDLAMDTLSICMNNLSLKEADFPTLLERALTHQTVSVKALALNTLLRELRFHLVEKTRKQMRQQQQQKSAGSADEDMNEPLVIKDLHEALLSATFEALKAKETEIGGPALNILSLISSAHFREPGVRQLLTDALRDGDDTVICRIYELAVNIAKRSDDSLSDVSFVLDHAVKDVTEGHKADALFLMNLLEILSNLTLNDCGISYLSRCNFLDTVNSLFERISSENAGDQNPDEDQSSVCRSMGNILMPSIYKFFGQITTFDPQLVIPIYFQVNYRLLDALCSDDLRILPWAFDAFANFAYTQRGIIYLESIYGDEIKATFIAYNRHLQRLQSPLKERAFQSLQRVFCCYDKDGIANKCAEVLHTWFKHLSGDKENMQFLSAYWVNPFTDIKLSCLRLIDVLCMYRWGAQAFSNTGGLLEYMLDRKTDHDKDVKHIKFEIMKKLLEHCDLFKEHDVELMNKFVREGPFYVEATTDIRIDGEE